MDVRVKHWKKRSTGTHITTQINYLGVIVAHSALSAPVSGFKNPNLPFLVHPQLVPNYAYGHKFSSDGSKRETPALSGRKINQTRILGFEKSLGVFI